MIKSLKARPPTHRNSRHLSSVHRGAEPYNRASPRVESTGRGVIPVIRDVVVPLDGTASAEHALPWALRIAESVGARVRVVYVHERMDQGFHGRRARLYGDFDRLLREPGEEYLADVMDRLRRAGAHDVTPMLLEGREVAETLAGLSKTADLTIIATRRRNSVSRLLLGSVSRSLLRTATKPMFVVRGYNYPVDLTARPILEHAMAPLDGSPGSEEVLPLLAALAKATDGSQTLLRVIPEERPFSLLKKVPKALVDLKEIVKRWKAIFPKLKTSLVWSDTRVKREVLKQVAEEKADFIGVATRGWSVSRMLRPGLVEYLLRHANVPLLVVKQRRSRGD